MNETSYINSVHRKLSPSTYFWKINDRFCNGVADAWYCKEASQTLFLEYKFEELPARPSTKVKAALSDNQYDWLAARQAQGVACAVVVGTPAGGVWFDDIDEARNGITRAEFEHRMQPPASIAAEIENRCSAGQKYEEHHGA